jgi:hypothetical protein
MGGGGAEMVIAKCIICGGIGKVPVRNIAGPGWVCSYGCLAKQQTDPKIDAALRREQNKWKRGKAAEEEE